MTTIELSTQPTTQDVGALMTLNARPPQRFVRGQGSWLVDARGERYLDFVQGWAVNTLGHCPEVVQRALATQASELINCSPAYHNVVAPRFAASLAKHSGLERVFFANSGAEANEGAIKLARKWGLLQRGGAFEIITFEGGFHGRTLATMAASGKAEFAPLFEPKVPGFPKARFGDLDSVRKLVGPRSVAVMLEPIQGEAGVQPASVEFLRALRSYTANQGLLLILDEIQTGIGRTGVLFDYQHAGIQPDILTLAKGIGGGVPLAALLAREEVSCFAPGDQGGTFNGNPLMCAVGEAILAIVATPRFLERVRAASARLWAGLEQLAQRHALGAVRGRGLLLALELPGGNASAVVDAARDHGLLVNAPRADSLRFMPALDVTDEEIDLAVSRLDQAIATCAA